MKTNSRAVLSALAAGPSQGLTDSRCCWRWEWETKGLSPTGQKHQVCVHVCVCTSCLFLEDLQWCICAFIIMPLRILSVLSDVSETCALTLWGKLARADGRASWANATIGVCECLKNTGPLGVSQCQSKNLLKSRKCQPKHQSDIQSTPTVSLSPALNPLPHKTWQLNWLADIRGQPLCLSSPPTNMSAHLWRCYHHQHRQTEASHKSLYQHPTHKDKLRWALNRPAVKLISTWRGKNKNDWRLQAFLLQLGYLIYFRTESAYWFL